MRRIGPVSVENGFDPTAERQRLLPLCRRWTGDAHAAEDIAQEAILVALRRRDRGDAPQEWASYLTGIARRLCLNWSSRRYKRESRLAPLEDNDIPTQEARRIQTTEDPLSALIQTEREDLIDHALAALKEPIRQLLIARYVEDLPLAELADRFGITENAMTVRIHRGREALRKVLATQLRTEAAAHGFLDAETAQGWRETPLYCCRCGTHRMVGRFEERDPQTGQPTDFALRCPHCTGMLVGMTSRIATMDSKAVLDGVSGFRAGLNRVNRWWQTYLDDALAQGKAPCNRCGKAITVHLGTAEEQPGLYLRCTHCRDTTFYIHPTGLLYHSDEAQAFWRKYPKIRNRADRSIIFAGRPAVWTSFADTTTSAAVEMIFDRETLQRLHVSTR